MKIFTLQNKILRNLLIILFWIGIWQLISMFIKEEILFVSPLKVFNTLWIEIRTLEFWLSIRNTTVRIFGGFLLGFTIGTSLAMISYRFKIIKELIYPLLLLIKTVPVVSFIILALVLIGSRNLSLLISAIMTIPLVYFNILEGIISTDKNLLIMAKMYNFSIGDKVKYIYLENLKPFLLTTVQTVMGLAFKSGIAAEVIGIPSMTIGERLYESKIYLDTAELFAYTFVIIMTSLIFEKFILLLFKGVLNND